MLRLTDRFWSKVDKSGECWLWTARLDDGYGRFNGSGLPSRRAHRLSYLALVGDIPTNAQVDHLCHNRRCVNPAHLRIADHATNQANRSGAQRNSATGVRGVSWDTRRGKYAVTVQAQGKSHFGGRFDTLNAATEAAQELRARLH